MKTPSFWYRNKKSPAAALLAPLGWVYGRATAARLRSKAPTDPGAPVICVGNLTAGGAGKTPVARDLALRLKARGIAVHLLTRAHGAKRQPQTPHRVLLGEDDVAAVGDEALLLARAAPTWTVPDRETGARRAVEAGAKALLLDDGFQDPSLKKSLSLVVVDGEDGFGNGALIPGGPLREPVHTGLGRADAVVVMGEDRRGLLKQVAAIGGGSLPVFRADVIPGPELAALGDAPVIAFAGLGRPEKFFRSLERAGCQLIAQHAFADHHPYTRAELARLMNEAERLGARLVTTEKDLVRLPPGFEGDVTCITISLSWRDEAKLESLLHPLFQGR